MALGTLQIVGLTGLGIASAAVVYRGVKSPTFKRWREQGILRPVCPVGLTATKVEGDWRCLPVAQEQACLEGVVVHDRVPMPGTLYASLTPNARKTAEQFFGFHLSTQAIEEGYAALLSLITGSDEPESAYYRVLVDLMPCGWPLWGGQNPPIGFRQAPNAQISGWPLDWNYYLDPPPEVTARMGMGARSLADLWIVALAQSTDQFFPVDVDPTMLISDPDKDTCASDDVLGFRAPGVPTSEIVILEALTVAGYEPQQGNVNEIMGHLETENPLLVDYLDADWRITAPKQESMWGILQDVANYPRPVTNVVHNTQTRTCPWDEKDAYTPSMATLWYSAKRMAAIAELVSMTIPKLVKEGG